MRDAILKPMSTTSSVGQRIYAVVRQIPEGKVATYGDVARVVGCSPRQVGFWLHRNPNPASIPCHRVVFANGSLSSAFAFGGEKGHAERLSREGVTIVHGAINLTIYRALLETKI